jgi:glycerate kinase
MRMRILIACDKFKGTLSAREVAAVLQARLSLALPEAEFDLCPIADGGEGTTEAVITALGGDWVECPVVDARSRPRHARYGWSRSGAVLEMSAANGLAQVLDLPLEPALATTRGTGQMIADALARGAQHLLVGIGGSATNDGGAGMAAALGHRFLDANDRIIDPLPSHFQRIARIEPAQLSLPPIQVACDVDNPLLGPRGATAVYGAQKGVCDPAFFENGLAHLADLVRRDLGCDCRDLPGAGAAGGLGWGLMVFCQATLTSGFDLVAGHIGLEERVARADLVLTGEGRLDAQTLCGKGPVGVAQMARRLGKPVVAYAGVIEDSPELHACFDHCFATKPEGMELTEALACASELLAAAADRSGPALRSLTRG